MTTTLSTENQNIFESIKHIDENGTEFWLARELMPLLDYKTWEGFHEVIKRAGVALKKFSPQSSDHIRQVSKKIKVAVGTNRESERLITDYYLSRRACYLIVQNGDSKKEAIALAQNYFASQTRKKELKEIKEKDIFIENLEAFTQIKKVFSYSRISAYLFKVNASIKFN
jgi:DNA-damage-inducible protein D